MTQYKISATSNIPGGPFVDLGTRKDGELGVNEDFPLYRPMVGSQTLLTHYAHAPGTVTIPAHGTGGHCYKSLHTFEIRTCSGRRLSVFEADYAATSNDLRSVSGVGVLLGDTVIGWKRSTKNASRLPHME